MLAAASAAATGVYAGYDLDKRTLPYMIVLGFSGRRHGLNQS
jgi:hypothetical protein